MIDQVKTESHVLVLRLTPFETEAEAAHAREWVERQAERGSHVTLLAAGPSLPAFQGLSATIWPDGATNGLLKLLALVRRISWGSFSDIYDLENSRRTKVFRWFVRPCPPWHSGLDEKPQKHKGS